MRAGPPGLVGFFQSFILILRILRADHSKITPARALLVHACRVSVTFISMRPALEIT